MAKKSRANKKKRSAEAPAAAPAYNWLFLGGAAAVLLAVVGGLLWYLMRPASPATADNAQTASSSASPQTETESLAEETPRQWPAGPANRCFAGPRFPQTLGFAAGQAYIGVSPGQYVGLFLADASGSGRNYQDPSWDDAGNMGAFVYDGNGNVYLAPAPFMNLSVDRLDNQTKLYRIDTDSAQMTMLLELTAAAPPSPTNPYGLIGLFYDCDTNSLYVSSVAGSTGHDERGRLFQVDLQTNEVVSTVTDLDALGVGVYNGAGGKRLYYGSGRTTGIYSIALDNSGHFKGSPRLEFYLAAQAGGRNDKGARITFNPEGQMVVKGLDFPYTLSVERPVIYRDYSFRYAADGDAWELVNIEQRTK
ncbi:MAG: hypothetical protein H6641_09640 [Caldilineaceae bacterium]|nr:hypothetical protein [Caldilineaceae bacterium]